MWEEIKKAAIVGGLALLPAILIIVFTPEFIDKVIYDWIFSSGQDFGTLIAAIAAVFAINGWKKQHAAEIKTKFLDDLSKEIDLYLASLSHALLILEIIQKEIERYWASDILSNKSPEVRYREYVKNQGEMAYSRLATPLDKLKEVESRVSFLIRKGKAFSLNSYFENCEGPFAMLHKIHSDIAFYHTLNLGIHHYSKDYIDTRSRHDGIIAKDSQAALIEWGESLEAYIEDQYRALIK